MAPEPEIPFAVGDRVRVNSRHDGPSAGRFGRVTRISPEPYDRAKDFHGWRKPRGLSTRFAWVLLDGEQFSQPYWPEVLDAGVRSEGGAP